MGTPWPAPPIGTNSMSVIGVTSFDCERTEIRFPLRALIVYQSTPSASTGFAHLLAIRYGRDAVA